MRKRVRLGLDALDGRDDKSESNKSLHEGRPGISLSGIIMRRGHEAPVAPAWKVAFSADQSNNCQLEFFGTGSAQDAVR